MVLLPRVNAYGDEGVRLPVFGAHGYGVGAGLLHVAWAVGSTTPTSPMPSATPTSSATSTLRHSFYVVAAVVTVVRLMSRNLRLSPTAPAPASTPASTPAPTPTTSSARLVVLAVM